MSLWERLVNLWQFYSYQKRAAKFSKWFAKQSSLQFAGDNLNFYDWHNFVLQVLLTYDPGLQTLLQSVEVEMDKRAQMHGYTKLAKEYSVKINGNYLYTRKKKESNDDAVAEVVESTNAVGFQTT